MKWEYKVISDPYMGSEIDLERLGSEGWELCSVLAKYAHQEYYFKRLVSEAEQYFRGLFKEKERNNNASG